MAPVSAGAEAEAGPPISAQKLLALHAKLGIDSLLPADGSRHPKSQEEEAVPTLQSLLGEIDARKGSQLEQKGPEARGPSG